MGTIYEIRSTKESFPHRVTLGKIRKNEMMTKYVKTNIGCPKGSLGGARWAASERRIAAGFAAQDSQEHDCIK